jgi:hypothetical protein
MTSAEMERIDTEAHHIQVCSCGRCVCAMTICWGPALQYIAAGRSHGGWGVHAQQVLFNRPGSMRL